MSAEQEVPDLYELALMCVGLENRLMQELARAESLATELQKLRDEIEKLHSHYSARAALIDHEDVSHFCGYFGEDLRKLLALHKEGK